MMSHGECSILLVEDDPNDIFLIERAFRRANLKHSIHVVKDGDEAVLFLEGQGCYIERENYPLPALILLDLKLPRRSGLEVLEWLKQQPLLKRIPVVVLTSSRENIDIDRAYDIGVNSYLIKPVAFNALLEMMQALDSYWLQFNQYPSIYLS
ncbi:two-component system response regulator [Fischerella major NIES-592]|uniref:Two-component system response regulator n=1 Tax=Fischerella major NIES-592 TaxID=210994 RepID=A0A1U7H4L6_9CYAN|nr:response regulator [Fischerella major]OKH16243.1 two-component system response regulator [Fischerella major NIES-592]